MPSHIPVPREFSVYTGFTKPIAQDLRLDRQLVALRERARAAAMEVSPDPLTPRAPLPARAGRSKPVLSPSHSGSPTSPPVRSPRRPFTATLPEVSDLAKERAAKLRKAHEEEMALKRVQVDAKRAAAARKLQEEREKADAKRRQEGHQWAARRAAAAAALENSEIVRIEQLRAAIEEREAAGAASSESARRAVAERRAAAAAEKRAHAAEHRAALEQAQEEKQAREVEKYAVMQQRLASAAERHEAGKSEARQRNQYAAAALTAMELDAQVAAGRKLLQKDRRERARSLQGSLDAKEAQLEPFRQRRLSRASSSGAAPAPAPAAAPPPMKSRDTHASMLASRASANKYISGAKPQKCACCERAYDSLPGVTYLKAVGELRAAWGDTTLSKKSKMSNVNRMYETVRICLFCTQYFEETAENQ